MLGSILGSSAWGATIAHLQFVSDTGGSGVFTFTVDGLLTQLFCDQFEPNATTLPYTANVATLADLTGSTLALQNDPQALQKYQWVAILDLIALADPAKAVDAVRANRRIVDGMGPLTPGAQTLFNQVTAANPAAYNLTGFRIFTKAGTQEVTGFGSDFELNATPEPGALVLFGSGLAAMAWLRQRRSI